MDLTYSDECGRFHTLMSIGRKKSFQYVKRMSPLFRAVVKFCSTNSVFIYKLNKKNLGEKEQFSIEFLGQNQKVNSGKK